MLLFPTGLNIIFVYVNVSLVLDVVHKLTFMQFGLRWFPSVEFCYLSDCVIVMTLIYFRVVSTLFCWSPRVVGQSVAFTLKLVHGGVCSALHLLQTTIAYWSNYIFFLPTTTTTTFFPLCCHPTQVSLFSTVVDLLLCSMASYFSHKLCCVRIRVFVIIYRLLYVNL